MKSHQTSLLIALGIAWAANFEIPKGGIESPSPDVSDVTPRKTN